MKNLKMLMTSSRRRAFTLVEVSIAMAIGLMASLAVMSVFISSSKMAVESFMRNKTTMDARLVIDKLTSDVRMASTVESSFGKFKSDNKTLILKMPSLNADGFAIDPDTKFDRVIYHQEGKSPVRFVRTVSADAASARVSGDENMGDSASPGVYTVQPDPLGNFVIYYQFNSVQTRGDKSITIPSAGSIQLRNHS